MIYHATYPTNAESIKREGLRELTFFANTPGYALAFLATRGGREYVGVRTVKVGDADLEVPQVIEHEEIVVFAVDPDKLPVPPAISDDHTATFYPDDLVCYVSEASIAPEHVIEYHTYKIADLLAGVES